MNYYNEFDPKAAAWLRQLIADGHLPPGDVDERSIEDVTPNDLRGYTQCHFFAGIGGWAYALDLAGWPRDQPVWTGSCPCQPFSTAGQGAGFDDQRHLWPAWFHLINQCRPASIFGEQVASPDALRWFDLVCDDLEGAGYATGAADLCASGVGSPHIRQRLFWVANGHGSRLQIGTSNTGISGKARGADSRQDAFGGCALGGLADSDENGRTPGRALLPDATEYDAEHGGGSMRDGWAGPLAGQWRDADWLRCRDGRWRPVEPGTFPLAYGIPAHVVRLSGYGNAIVPLVAAEFVKAFAGSIG